jgi:selenocysteine lyase/cysteine desulfurase
MRIGTSNVEHNAVIRPLTALSRLRGVTVVSVPCDAVGLPDADALPDDIGLLVTTAASNVTGGIADIPRLAAACRAKGIALVVDAAQAAGSIPLDFSGVAAVAAAGHKGLLGPQGTGFVWFAPGVEPAPYLYGGTGSDSDATAMPDYWPDRFEAGTVNTPGLAGLAAGVAWIIKKGIAAVREQETAFCETILNRMVDDDRIAVYPPFPAAARASLICFNVIGRDPAEVADAFDRRGFAVRAGLHCSPDGHRFIGTFPTGAVRVSPGPLTKAKQVAAFLTALDRIAKET